jgi:hypothetical protein
MMPRLLLQSALAAAKGRRIPLVDTCGNAARHT